MGRFDIIILTLTKTQDDYDVLINCIKSYLDTAGDLIKKIIVVESNPDFVCKYAIDKLEYIIPKIPFNYNQFYLKLKPLSIYHS